MDALKLVCGLLWFNVGRAVSAEDLGEQLADAELAPAREAARVAADVASGLVAIGWAEDTASGFRITPRGYRRWMLTALAAVDDGWPEDEQLEREDAQREDAQREDARPSG